MTELIFATGNGAKFGMGEHICREFGINLKQARLEIDEVQSENSEYVAKKKAEAAYAQLQKPVVISDDSWAFPGLNGFPGTYMKSMNHWFRPEDFINLTRDLKDRRAVIIQILVYQYAGGQKLFRRETAGTLLTEARGSVGDPCQKVVTLDEDNGKSISEIIGEGHFYAGRATLKVWHDLAEWLADKP